jgi:hypothetical protein
MMILVPPDKPDMTSLSSAFALKFDFKSELVGGWRGQ